MFFKLMFIKYLASVIVPVHCHCILHKFTAKILMGETENKICLKSVVSPNFFSIHVQGHAHNGSYQR